MFQPGKAFSYEARTRLYVAQIEHAYFEPHRLCYFDVKLSKLAVLYTKGRSLTSNLMSVLPSFQNCKRKKPVYGARSI